MKVLNFGSLNIDYVYRVHRILEAGETMSSLSREKFPGGKGLNQSIALAKAGIPVFHAGITGKGGEFLLDWMGENGVNTQYVKVEPEMDPGHTIIQVDDKGENCILLYGGGNQAQTREYIEGVLDGFGEKDVLLLQNEINELPYIIDRAFEKGMRIILNPSPMNEKLENCDLSKISLFILNEIEGAQLAGTEDVQEMKERLRALYPKAEWVLTLGTKGAYYLSRGKEAFQEAFPVQAVDTTAAGDTFTGYFIASTLKGSTVEDALKLASKAASVAVTRSGASGSIPVLSEIEL